ncbi:MAG: hypothetical protein K2P81_01200 [Bacteriovoracaceae bacterium]|nr:hypothetical protein [Bacteriovoracaceae bacterium]
MSLKNKEALFNEIKGSLFEYLCAYEVAKISKIEASFLKNLPQTYQRVLEQQDHMTRELYPELVSFLPLWSKQVALKITQVYKAQIKNVTLTAQLQSVHHEADFLINEKPVSLKLNKLHGSVNTKSGGIKSFLTQYFEAPQVSDWQQSYNQLVDAEFAIMRSTLHEMAGLEEDDSWQNWRMKGLSELPGELPLEMREVMHSFYARLASELDLVLKKISSSYPQVFSLGLARLCGFGERELLQVICFHEINGKNPEKVEVRAHDMQMVEEKIAKMSWRDFQNTASCEINLGDWPMQIRIKPMNKFTTTAIKINCSLRY